MLRFVILVAGAVAFWLSLPNEIIPVGLGFLGPLILWPVFWFTRESGPLHSLFGGAVWISLVTGLSQSWLIAFHPLAFPIVLFFQIPVYAGLFFLSSWMWKIAPTGLAPWLQAGLWTVAEYLRIQGFLGYPYDAAASTFWAYPITFQSADLLGTSGLTFLLAATSAWLAVGTRFRWNVTRRWGSLIVLVLLWCVNLGYGLLRLSAPKTGTPWTFALVQPSQDPWKGGPEAYGRNLDALIALSQRVDRPPVQTVVWPETAFVPSVFYHKRYHDNLESLNLVEKLEAFLESENLPYLLGNDHREKAFNGQDQDFNAVLLWDGGWKGLYKKNRLVPFTESFPYKAEFPWMYQWLLSADTHFWVPGQRQPVFTVSGVKMGTPVCFEDAFPESVREFAKEGARVLVNLTNDSWAPGVSSRYQHLSLAVFRTVETHLPLVISANDGATAAITSQGEVNAVLPVGPAGVLQAKVLLGSGEAPASVWYGDLPVQLLALMELLLFAIFGGIWVRKRSYVDKHRHL